MKYIKYSINITLIPKSSIIDIFMLRLIMNKIMKSYIRSLETISLMAKMFRYSMKSNIFMKGENLEKKMQD